jgi:splicing factor 3B subunit 1
LYTLLNNLKVQDRQMRVCTTVAIAIVAERRGLARGALGPNVVLQYTLQGLYHPARKVREAYWRVCNCLYLFNSDALVAGYPAIEDEGENRYPQTALDNY